MIICKKKMNRNGKGKSGRKWQGTEKGQLYNEHGVTD